MRENGWLAMYHMAVAVNMTARSGRSQSSCPNSSLFFYLCGVVSKYCVARLSWLGSMPIRLGPSLPAPLIHIRFHPLFPVVQWAKSYQGHFTFLGRVPFQEKCLLSLFSLRGWLLLWWEKPWTEGRRDGAQTKNVYGVWSKFSNSKLDFQIKPMADLFSRPGTNSRLDWRRINRCDLRFPRPEVRID